MSPVAKPEMTSPGISFPSVRKLKQNSFSFIYAIKTPQERSRLVQCVDGTSDKTRMYLPRLPN